MEESRRKAYIKAQATKKKQKSSKATAQAHPSSKRKPSEKVDRPPKKPKVVAKPIVGETAATGKLPPKPGKGKGLMTGWGTCHQETPHPPSQGLPVRT